MTAAIEGRLTRESRPDQVDTLYHKLQQWLADFRIVAAEYPHLDPTRILDRQGVFLDRVVEDWIVNPVLTYMRKECERMGTSK